jgi:hypothetical protein
MDTPHFIGIPGSPEWDRFMRQVEGGPENIDHLERRNADGWLIEKPFQVPDPDPDTGYLHEVSGVLRRGYYLPIGMKWILASVEVFRGPDKRHYGVIYGMARTRERAKELHWLSGYATVDISHGRDASKVIAIQVGDDLFPIHEVGGPMWPDVP